jgi:hypothetical protein
MRRTRRTRGSARNFTQTNGKASIVYDSNLNKPDFDAELDGLKRMRRIDLDGKYTLTRYDITPGTLTIRVEYLGIPLSTVPPTAYKKIFNGFLMLNDFFPILVENQLVLNTISPETLCFSDRTQQLFLSNFCCLTKMTKSTAMVDYTAFCKCIQWVYEKVGRCFGHNFYGVQ